MFHRVRPIALCLVLALVGAGCSSSDDGEATVDSANTMAAAEDGGEAVEPTDDLAAAIAEIEGIEVYEGLTRDHVDDPVYEVRPPAGGDHLNQWAECAFYDEVMHDGNMVHSLEHGAVWIAYDPDLDEASLSTIETVVNSERQVLASPYPGMDTSVVMVAWGVRLPLDTIDDARFIDFLALFAEGPQTPELGAPC